MNWGAVAEALWSTVLVLGLTGIIGFPVFGWLMAAYDAASPQDDGLIRRQRH